MAPRPRITTIEPPQISTQLVAGWFESEQFGDQALLAEASFSDLDLSGRAATDVTVDRAVLRRVLLNASELQLAQLLDSRLDGCDLAQATWQKAHMQRVEFLGCRMVGFALFDSQCDNLVVQRCNAESARFWNCSFRASCFDTCSLKHASFENTDLSGVVFQGCDLTGADLRRAKLKGTDLRGCTLDALKVNLADLHGVILEPAQLGLLAALAGVDLRLPR